MLLTPELENILVGLLLGDLCIRKTTKNSNPRCQFSQGLIHKDYLFHLYDLFKYFCLSEPSIKDRKPNSVTGKVYTTVSFDSICLPCFSELFQLFYPDGKKVVPLNIGDLLTPAGLAM
jgi:hypothetical protein